jgi:hypothetical protein
MKKTRHQFIVILGSAIISSFLGGMIGNFIFSVSSLHAKVKAEYFQKIRTKTIHLVGKNNKIRASFYLGVHDNPELVLYDSKGTNRFNFGLAPAGNPGMTFNNDDFQKVLEFGTKYGHPKIELLDGQNSIVWKAP